ncbi:glycosyltransferase family 61 protein [Nocardioides humilatus]|uniref:Glycosyltransferase family 61 protein n=1 Tax=Nocardioides humilatus TaxID=2607660 RepID=A0A5B1LNV3_9ACTN|nr:glycosyltransferase family 61 protein [Nocardioides humilatus]KAA1421460.1 glycosyltransferase family 61 protein [Nocardioides humilatus]
MSKLPARFQPLWPLLKRVHRFLSVLAGVAYRPFGRFLGVRGLPRTATTASTVTAEREAGAVTLHPAGPAEILERGPAQGTPAAHWVFERGRHAEVPARYVLDIRDGRMVGDFGATVTPGGILDYQTSGYFGLQSWREHPVFLRPRLPEVEHHDGTLLSLTTRGTAGNYYHFLYDAVARYGIFEDALPGERVDGVIVPHGSGYQRQILELAGIPGPYIQPRPDRTISADRLLVPSTPNQDLVAPRSATEWLRKRLPPSGATGTPTKLYLSRGQQPGARRYLQEGELWPLLERQGFVMLDPGTLSVQEQIDVFHNAEVIVAPHGAALTNITWSRPGVRVLEMFAGTYVHLGLWTIAEAIGGIDYRYLVGTGTLPVGKEPTGIVDDIDIPAEVVMAELEALTR